MHKARVKLLRTPLEEFQGQVGNRDQANPDPLASDLLAGEGKADEFAYQLAIVEDFNDDRVHSFEDDEPQPSRHDDVELAGIRELIPIHQISKIFYADTGKILNIGSEGEANSPVLLLKRDVHAIPPRRMIDRGQVRSSRYGDDSSRESQHGRSEFYDDPSAVEDQPLHASAVLGGQQPTETDPWRLPPNLDPEWIAFEVYVEHEDSDDDDEAAASDVDAVESPRPSIRSREPSVDPQLANALALLHLNSPGTTPTSQQQQQQQQQQLILRSPLPLLANSTFSGGGSSPIRTSLSLLEMLIRLTALQQFQQASHLSIPDELLNFFLSESSTTGAGVDGEERRRKRWEARRKVGFDPYDESPVKRRGETGGGRTTDRQRSYELAEDDDDDADHEHEHDRWFSSPPHHRASSSQSSQSILPLPYANSENPSPMLLRSRRNRDALHWSTPSPMSSTSMSSRAPNLNSSPNHDPPPGRAPPEHAQSSPSGPGPAPGSDGLRSRSAALRDDLASSRAKQGSPLRRTHTVQGQDDVVESATMSRPADKRGDER
ncbi:MAG: hypothetical protein M1826_003150 [Phylliscum demangeonii]|nr:MAG: hypothetical protein M1826_003150 [Phylliscum demangeonii]